MSMRVVRFLALLWVGNPWKKSPTEFRVFHFLCRVSAPNLTHNSSPMPIHVRSRCLYAGIPVVLAQSNSDESMSINRIWSSLCAALVCIGRQIDVWCVACTGPTLFLQISTVGCSNAIHCCMVHIGVLSTMSIPVSFPRLLYPLRRLLHVCRLSPDRQTCLHEQTMNVSRE